MSDFFVPDDDMPPPGVTVRPLPSVGDGAEVALEPERRRIDAVCAESLWAGRNGSRALVLAGLAAAAVVFPS